LHLIDPSSIEHNSACYINNFTSVGLLLACLLIFLLCGEFTVIFINSTVTRTTVSEFIRMFVTENPTLSNVLCTHIILLLARLMGQYYFARWCLSSVGICNTPWRASTVTSRWGDTLLCSFSRYSEGVRSSYYVSLPITLVVQIQQLVLCVYVRTVTFNQNDL